MNKICQWSIIGPLLTHALGGMRTLRQWSIVGSLLTHVIGGMRTLRQWSIVGSLLTHVIGGMRTHRELWIMTTILVVIFGWVYRDLAVGPQLMVSDLAPWYSTGGETWEYFTNAWSQTNLGWANPLIFGNAVVQSVLTSVTGDPATAQRLYFLSLLPISIISMFLLLRYITTSPFVRIAVALAYGINGMTITWFVVGGHPFLSVLASFPLLILFFLKFLREPDHKLRNLLVFTAIASFETGLMPYFPARVFPILFATWLLESIQRKSRRFALTTFVWLIGAGIVYFILTSPLNVRQMMIVWDAISGASNGTIGLSSPRDIASTANELVTNYNSSYALQMIRNSFILVVTLAIAGVFITNRSRRYWYYGMVLLAFIVIVVMESIALGASKVVFEQLPFLLPFKDPDKLQAMLLQPVFIAVALLMDDFANRQYPLQLHRFRLSQVHVIIGMVVLAGGVFGIVTEAHPPYASNYNNLKVFLTTGFQTNLLIPGVATHEVPVAYENAASWIRERRESEEFFRTLWVPDNKIVQRNLLPIYDPPSFRKPNDISLVHQILDPLFNLSNFGLAENLGEVGVKYVVVVDPQWDWYVWQKENTGNPRPIEVVDHGFIPVGSPQVFNQALLKHEGLNLIHVGEGFNVFRNNSYQPHFSVFGSIIGLLSSDLVEPPSGNVLELLPNLLKNGDFIDGSQGWTTSKTNDPGNDIATHSDANSSTLPVSAPARPNFSELFQTVDVQYENTFQIAITGWAKKAERSSMRIFYLDDSNNPREIDGKKFQRIPLEFSSDNMTQLFLISPPRGTARIRILLELASHPSSETPGAVWLDRVSLNSAGFGINEDQSEVLVAQNDTSAELDVPIDLLPYLDLTQAAVRNIEGTDTKNQPFDILVFDGNPSLEKFDQQSAERGDSLLMLYEAETSLVISPFYPVPLEIPPDVALEIPPIDNPSNLLSNGSFLQGVEGWDLYRPKRLDAIAPQTNVVTGLAEIAILAPARPDYNLIGQHTDVVKGTMLQLSIRGRSTSAGASSFKIVYLDVDEEVVQINGGQFQRVAINFNSTASTEVFFLTPPAGTVRIGLFLEVASKSGQEHSGNASVSNISLGTLPDGFQPPSLEPPSLESKPYTVIPTVSLIGGSNLGRHRAAVITTPATIEMSVSASRPGWYRILVRGLMKHPTVKIGGQELAISRITQNSDEIGWFESEAVQLSRGNFVALFEFQDGEVVIDQLAVLATKNQNSTTAEALSVSSVSIDVTPKSFGEFEVIVETTGRYHLEFRESFDPLWRAQLENGESLEHFATGPKGWANGFSSPSDQGATLIVSYSAQESRDRLILIWLTGWTITIVLILLLSVPPTSRFLRRRLKSVRFWIGSKVLFRNLN